MANDIAAIHVLKTKLQLQDGDYRALLLQLTGVSSCKQMAPRQLAAVRDHLQRLAERSGVAPARRLTRAQFAQAKDNALPKERKAWALWHQLHRDGRIADNSAAALNAFVFRQVQVSALGFCNDKQIDTVIESLKGWDERK